LNRNVPPTICPYPLGISSRAWWKVRYCFFSFFYDAPLITPVLTQAMASLPKTYFWSATLKPPTESCQRPWRDTGAFCTWGLQLKSKILTGPSFRLPATEAVRLFWWRKSNYKVGLFSKACSSCAYTYVYNFFRTFGGENGTAPHYKPWWVSGRLAGRPKMGVFLFSSPSVHCSLWVVLCRRVWQGMLLLSLQTHWAGNYIIIGREEKRKEKETERERKEKRKKKNKKERKKERERERKKKVILLLFLYNCSRSILALWTCRVLAILTSLALLLTIGKPTGLG